MSKCRYVVRQLHLLTKNFFKVATDSENVCKLYACYHELALGTFIIVLIMGG